MATCTFCGSGDTMPPFRKPERIPLLSAFTALRRRYCRSCSRHFITSRTSPRRDLYVPRDPVAPGRPPE